MPDLSNLLDSSSLTLIPIAEIVSDSRRSGASSHRDIAGPETLEDNSGWFCIRDRRLRYRLLDKGSFCPERHGSEVMNTGKNRRRNKSAIGKTLEDHVRVWVEKKVASGVSKNECRLPFLTNAPKAVECRMCGKFVHSGEEVLCSIQCCRKAYCRICARTDAGFSSLKAFKCPQHACFICKQKGFWRCTRCSIAAHSRCAPWPDDVIYPIDQTARAVCWRHHSDWRFEKHAVPAIEIEEIFQCLPLPYVDKEFNIEFMLKDIMENEREPVPYVHIRRNVYLVKKKRLYADADAGCTNCEDKSCCKDCVCRVQSISCSKACHCSETCTNRPFRKEKKVKVVKTNSCGWGVEAAESIKKGDFVIEYIGEVIDDALCEQRLWDMKHRDSKDFYMCEIQKDFTIDATFKGNSARFLNHSCDPNCKLEKWQVDGETRLGVFASRSIKVGEPLTYDYRFVHFGPNVRCCCGAEKCQGYLGSKRKMDNVDALCWGKKRKRSIPYV